MPSKADAQARLKRAQIMAKRMHDRGDYAAQQVWLAEADKYTKMLAAMNAHPAYKGRK